MREISSDITGIDDIILMPHSVKGFFATLKFTSIEQIEMIMKGKSDNTAWFQFRKGTITASKFVKGESGYVNMWSLCQKISGLISINPNIPGRQYGRDMEQHAFKAFFEIFKCNRRNLRLCNCGLFLDCEQLFISASPDGIVECSCHG